MTSKKRILVISHEHPDFSHGGAEIAAYNLFKSYLRSKDVEEAWFLARADRGAGANGNIRVRRENEYLWEQGVADWSMRSANRDSLLGIFRDLLERTRPTHIHAHHYVHMGVEMFRVIKQVDPSIQVILTLHEYIAICANNGQMVKTNGRLCYGATDEDCRRCFPERSVEDFWLRRHYLAENLGFVDVFVSPSEFLRSRYIEWGIPSEKIVVIENGQADIEPLPPRKVGSGEHRNVFGYFGQINKFKGLPTILGALKLMTEEARSKVVVEVHGANLEKQPPEFREMIEEAISPLINEGVVKWAGPYEPHELSSRLQGVDWVLVPSTWWENSPMVIQEAFQHGRPPIVSDIGGMSEKVRHNIDGLKVTAGNEMAWAKTLAYAAEKPLLWDRLFKEITPRANHEECCALHLALIDSLEGR